MVSIYVWMKVSCLRSFVEGFIIIYVIWLIFSWVFVYSAWLIWQMKAIVRSYPMVTLIFTNMYYTNRYTYLYVLVYTCYIFIEEDSVVKDEYILPLSKHPHTSSCYYHKNSKKQDFHGLPTKCVMDKRCNCSILDWDDSLLFHSGIVIIDNVTQWSIDGVYSLSVHNRIVLSQLLSLLGAI